MAVYEGIRLILKEWKLNVCGSKAMQESKVEDISLCGKRFYQKKVVINAHHFLNLVTNTYILLGTS